MNEILNTLDAEVLDLQGLCDRCLGNLDLVERVLNKFEQRLPGELAELEQLLESADAAKIATAAHRIKGNSANVSAVGLARTAAAMEDHSRAGRVAELHSQMQDLRAQWARFVDCRAALRQTAAVGGRVRTSPRCAAAWEVVRQ
jgi:HPt (histidine-containing phosphotransfer) domain-containing protein